MRLHISHKTHYAYDQPVPYGLQQVRLTPKSCATQSIDSWTIAIDGGREESSFDDQHGNRVQLISIDAGQQEISITCSGDVDTLPTNGVVGPHSGFAPLWYYKRQTPLTRPGKLIRKLAADMPENLDQIGRLHDLSATIREAIAYETDRTDSGTTYVADVGWIGFDVSNVISPDERYVRIATGLDYDEAAPISGIVFGGAAESLLVSLQVQQ